MRYTTRRHFISSISTISAIAVAEVASAAPAWTWSKARGDETEFIDPDGRFRLRYPSGKWHRLPGGGSSLLTLVQKDCEAAVTIEYAELKVALAPEEIADLFAELEVAAIETRFKQISAARSAVAELSGRPLVTVDFQRPLKTGTEQVRHYIYPSGRDVYRLVCSATVPAFLTHTPAFAAMAGAFTVLPSQWVRF